MNHSHINKIIGHNLRKIRLRSQKSMNEVASNMGLSFQQIHKFETGKDSIKFNQLLDIAMICDYNPQQLVTDICNDIDVITLDELQCEITNNHEATKGDRNEEDEADLFEDLSKYMRPMRARRTRQG